MSRWRSPCWHSLVRFLIPPDKILGQMLATGAAQLPESKAPAAELYEQMSVDAAMREMTRVCLVQILGNTSVLAAGFGGHEHVHQARVGIRKLRTVLAELGAWCPAIDPAWRTDLARVFSVLGQARDRDVVLAGWLRTFEREGSPKLTLPQQSVDVTGDLLRGFEFTTLMRALLAYAHGAPDAGDDDPMLIDIVRRTLTKLHRKSIERADGFSRLSVVKQHDIRRRLKRLRYVAELTASLFGRKTVARYVAMIEPAQDALGALNDLSVATERFTALAAIDPHAWFAVGWLRARFGTSLKACERPLRNAERATTYWSR